MTGVTIGSMYVVFGYHHVLRTAEQSWVLCRIAVLFKALVSKITENCVTFAWRVHCFDSHFDAMHAYSSLTAGAGTAVFYLVTPLSTIEVRPASTAVRRLNENERKQTNHCRLGLSMIVHSFAPLHSKNGF